MAVWQFHVFVVPRDAERPHLVGDGWAIPSLNVGAWAGLETNLRHKLGAPSDHRDGALVFGAENGNRVDLSRDDDTCELAARLDARDANEGFVEFVCELARMEGCVFFAPESGSDVQPNSADLASALAISKSAKFCGDPRGFLKGLADAGKLVNRRGPTTAGCAEPKNEHAT